MEVLEPTTGPTTPTSLTARTTNFGSTICATTCGRGARDERYQSILQQSQEAPAFAIVDEVDTILIDEAARR